MKTKLSSLLLAALLAGPMSANAANVDWAINGQFDFINGSQSGGFPVQPGDFFSFVMHFDSATPGGCSPSGAGTVCHYNNPGLFYTDGIFGPIVQGTVPFNSSFVEVYDDATSPFQGLPGNVDGYMFRGFNTDGPANSGDAQKWSVYLLTQDLSYFSGQPGLPSTPPSLNGLTSYFRFCRSDGPQGTGCELVLLQGPISSATSVPEPGTLAILALGLVGIGVSRRRKQ
jgi:PEP-CTERM motif